jgi:hypothetical protein
LPVKARCAGDYRCALCEGFFARRSYRRGRGPALGARRVITPKRASCSR